MTSGHSVDESSSPGIPADLARRLRTTQSPDPAAIEELLTAFGGETDGVENDRRIAEVAAALGARATERLYDNARRRLAWLTAAVEITETLINADATDALQLVAAGAREVTGGEISSIEVPTGVDCIRVEAYDGPDADQIRGRVVPIDDAPLYRAVTERGEPMLIADAATDPLVLGSPALAGLELGCVMVVPLLSSGKSIGALIIGNAPQSRAFADVDLEFARTFGTQASLVFEFLQAQQDRRRIAILEDRESLAFDLSERVMGRLLAIGTQLQAAATTVPHTAADRMLNSVNELDAVIEELRSAILSLDSTSRS